MGEVVAFEPGGAARASKTPQDQPAAIVILPAIRIERQSDPWQDLPSDSAPPYSAPDTDGA
jgi:hypothetical protein